MTAEITIIGKGKMGKVIASYFEKSGMPVQLIGRDKENIEGKFVILAIPSEAMIDTITTYRAFLKDKILIDISNPVDYTTKASTLDVNQSMSLILAQKFPELTFVKGFNTNFASSRVEVTDTPIVLLAGDDKDAKEAFVKLLEKAQFNVVDNGSLETSIDLEAFARVQMAVLASGYTHTISKFAL